MIGHGHQQVKAGTGMDLVEQFRREMFGIGEDQGVTFFGVEDIGGQVEQFRGRLSHRSGGGGEEEANRLVSVGIQGEEGLGHLGGSIAVVVSMTAHLAFTVTAHAMGIDSQQLGLVVTGGAANLSQCHL